MVDHSRWGELYLSLRKQLIGVAAKIAPLRDVEDIVQEAYVRLCLVKDPADVEQPQSYLFRIVRNLALDHKKSAENTRTDTIANIDEYLEEHVDRTLHSATTNEEFAVFCEAVRHLPTQCRKAFVLKKVYGYSQQEITDELGLSESTVEKHIALGIKRCAQFMERHYVIDTPVIGSVTKLGGKEG
tara:strand:+ start:2194 stop:2748 length:555 start_codon:yes stop_codon:yes gene_type:complete